MVQKDKPKIKGLSFNLFAIIALLVILPVSTAFVSNLADNSNQDFESVNKAYRLNGESYIYESCPSALDGDNMMMTWIDKGFNSSAYYESQMPGQDAEGLSSIWDRNDYFYNYLMIECTNATDAGYPPGSVDNNGNPVFGFVNGFTARNSDEFASGASVHSWASAESYLDGYTWPGYVQDIGDEFSFQIHDNYFKYLDSSQDLSSIKLQFIDTSLTWACDSIIFQDIKYKADIEFFKNGISIGSFENFEFERDNKYKVRYLNQPTSATDINGTFVSLPQGSEVCHTAFYLQFDLLPIEAITINDAVNRDYSNLSAIIEVYDLDFRVIDDNSVYYNPSLGLTTVGQFTPPIPILSDTGVSIDFSVAYQDTTNTNFILKGGTLIMGIGLFALAIANTPYWNPVINFFKEGTK